LQDTLDGIPKGDILVMLVDFNAICLAQSYW